MAFGYAETDKVSWKATRPFLTLVCSLSLILPAAAAATEIGIVTADTGSLLVVRQARRLATPLSPGFILESHDLLETSEVPGQFVIEGGGRIELLEETTVHLTLAGEAVEIELLTGSLRVTRTAAGEPLQVRSGELLVSPRTGTIEVAALPGELRLVTAGRGRHEVRSASGERRFVEPALPVAYDGSLSSLSEPPEVWAAVEIDAFASGGPGFFARRMERYLEEEGRFEAAWEEMLVYRSILERWFDRHARGLIPDVESDLEAEPALAAALSSLIENAESFEPTFFQSQIDGPLLYEEHRSYLEDQAAYLRNRLDEVRWLAMIAGAAVAATEP